MLNFDVSTVRRQDSPKSRGEVLVLSVLYSVVTLCVGLKGVRSGSTDIDGGE